MKYRGESCIYDIEDLLTLQNLIQQVAVCARCRGSIHVLLSDRLGLSTKICIRCTACGFCDSDKNSKVLVSGKPELKYKISVRFPLHRLKRAVS